AVVTIFVEGSIHERQERAGTRPERPIEEVIVGHPLVRFYGCAPEAMRLARAHRAVEGDHRRDAWDVLFRHIPADSSVHSQVAAGLFASSPYSRSDWRFQPPRSVGRSKASCSASKSS